jgi:hypothetical protein
MPLRNSSLAIEDLSDLSHLDELVVDKRFGQRSSAKKNRRNRHYEKQFIRNSLAHHLQLPQAEEVDGSGRLKTDAHGVREV